jgi:hypothetical protein
VDATEFGSRLVITGDLDPIYTMLNAAKLPAPTLKRWVLAYWMFYHAGVSSFIADAPSSDFWGMVWAAQNEKWPRGTERRHFKAENSRKAITHLQKLFPTAESAVEWVSAWDHRKLSRDLGYNVGDTRFEEILRRAQTWVGFGPWIAFKIADMVDAVLHVPVSFDNAVPYFFDDPIVGAFCVTYQESGVLWEGPELASAAKANVKSMSRTERIEIVQEAVNLLKAGPLGKMRSPTNPDRPLQIQEYETIFCKYKSHLNGHYPVGKDTAEILHVLLDKRWGPLAEKLAHVLDKVTS